jgi:RimJ/RimL family protein N-acetyltransferase
MRIRINHRRGDAIFHGVQPVAHPARRLDEHLGFTHEATLRGAAPDGGDVLLYVMRREDCRFIDKAKP